MYLLYLQVGIAFVPPVIYCFLIIPLATRLSKKVKENQMKVLGERDKRIKMICEILFGIRIIKYNVWEKHFAEVVNGIRNRELKFSFMIKLLLGAVFCIWGMTTSVMLLLSVGTYVLMGNALTASKVFTTLSVINRLVMPLNLLSFNINGIIDAWVALKRIQEFMCLPEINLNEYYRDRKSLVRQQDCPDVKLERSTFKWNLEGEVKLQRKEKEKSCSSCCSRKKKPASAIPRGKREEATNPFVLNDVSVSIKKGSFVGVSGKVGSGKSSLFASMTGEMEQYGGRAFLSTHLDEDGIAFFTQEPWIQHLSIKDNILFGDETEVGENGVNLSGGQKARVALARCIYQDKEMYLLDDPIAAVDAHVAKHIYNNCIMGLLQGKTRVLCTHHTAYLRNADHVILMKDGSVEAQGPPNEVLQDFEEVDLDEKTSEVEEDGEEEKEESKAEKEKAAKKGKLIEKEESRVGTVAFKVYKLYWKSYGELIAIAMLLSLALRQAGKNVQDWWLSHWVTEMEPVNINTNATFANTISSAISNVFESPYIPRLSAGNDDKDDVYYLSIYAYIVLGYLFFVASCAFIQAYGSIRASRVLHKKLLDAVMKTPVSYFDVTPTGRIVNRFSTDISDIDGRLPFIFQAFARQISSFIGTLVLTCISLPWFAALLVPLALVYYWIQMVYRRSSRELKRIGSVARSPLYEFFTETLAGYMTIRAFRENERFIAISDLKLDNSQRAAFNEQIAVLWLTFRLDLIGVVMVFAVSLLAVLEHHYGSTDAGMVGLAITYAVQITPILGGMLNVATEMEKQMVRVERLSQYVNDTPQEMERSKDVAPYWPDSGRVEFDSVQLRYRENLPLALDDVSFSVRSGEKVGICGRTGSGKSTLLKVLFNIIDITGGRILIDGIDIGKIDASILRSRMSIIPQDPFLFDGSVSRNLDPTGQFTTYEMLDVLDKCHLSKLVTDLGGLEGKVGEKGNNLSAGQKQLLCLARALLKKAKIICIDEATASVDLETDQLIQVTIREEFVKSTVLTIAHRMNTIIDSDRVLIMNAGNVLEFAPPEELLADLNSEFYALVNENSASTGN